jgi:hypothetical protein
MPRPWQRPHRPGPAHLAEKTVKNYMPRLLANVGMQLGMQRRTQVAVHAVERHHHARQRPGR